MPNPTIVKRKFKDGSQEWVVEGQWVKMLVKTRGDKGWDKYYSKLSYKKLGSNESHTLVAFLRPIDTEEPLPHYLELCTSGEVTKLNKTLKIY